MVSLSQGRTAAAQCVLFTYKSVPVIFEPPCVFNCYYRLYFGWFGCFNIQYVVDIGKFKVKYSYPQHVCVTCSSILNRRIGKPLLHKRKNEISYTSLQTHDIFSNVYCNIEVSTYPQNGDIVVVVVLVVTPVIKSSCHIVNCSARAIQCGASSYSESVRTHPIYGKALKCALCVVLP